MIFLVCELISTYIITYVQQLPLSISNWKLLRFKPLKLSNPWTYHFNIKGIFFSAQQVLFLLKICMKLA